MSQNPRIEIAARAVDHLALVIESAVRNADPSNHEAVVAALQINSAAVRSLDAARPEVEGDAVEQIAELIWPHVRRLARACSEFSWENVRGGTYAEEVTQDIARALIAARAPAAPDRRAERQARIEAAISACTECGGREFPKRNDCDGCTAAVDEAMEEERSAPAAPDAWQPIETAPKDGTRILGWAIEAEDDLMPQIIQWHQHKWVISHDITPMTGAKYFQLGSGEWEPTGHWEAPTHWQPLPKPPIEAAKDAKP